MRLKLALAALMVIGLAVSQTSTEKAYIWTYNSGRFALTEVTGLTRVGGALTVSSGESVKGGPGIIVTRVSGQPAEIAVDTAAFYMWVSPPSAPGECRSSVPISDQKILAQDDAFVYLCVPTTVNGVKTTRWGRAPLEFAW